MNDRQLNQNDKVRHVLTGETVRVISIVGEGYIVQGSRDRFHACEGELAPYEIRRPRSKRRNSKVDDDDRDSRPRRRNKIVVTDSRGKKIRMPSVRN